MNTIKEINKTIPLITKEGLILTVSYIEYETDGSRDYEEGTEGGVSLLNKKVFLGKDRIDRNPSFFNDTKKWLSVMNEADSFIFSVIEEAEKALPAILNMTQHPATNEQLKAGVVEPLNKKLVQELLTFDSIPDQEIIANRAEALAIFAKEYNRNVPTEKCANKVLIGGAPFLMAALEKALIHYGFVPVYAFSVRESLETIKDGIVTKTNVFKHVGFVEV